jgi:hypothetical protein
MERAGAEPLRVPGASVWFKDDRSVISVRHFGQSFLPVTENELPRQCDAILESEHESQQIPNFIRLFQ